MAKLQCEICGGSDLLKQGDVWVCQTCGSNYTAEDVKKMFQSAVTKENSEPLEKKAIVDVEEPTESVAKKDKKVTVAQVESEAVRVQMSDFTIVAGTLTKYNGIDTDVVIPVGVTLIGKECFRDMEGIRSVVIPDGVKKIANFAFAGCKGLTSIDFPDSIEEIQEHAFYNCAGLQKITIPKKVKNISKCSFSECTGLKSVSIHNGVERISEGAFESCTGLTEITIPVKTKVKLMGLFPSFENCTGLRSVTAGNETASGILYHNKQVVTVNILFGGDPKISGFKECEKLQTVTIEEGATVIIGSAFSGCGSLKKITIPNTVKKIESYAFEGCRNLSDITIPDSVEEIQNGAFSKCDNLSLNVRKKVEEKNPEALKGGLQEKKDGCYVATCVYGDYNCPEVWTLRRYRDDTLGATWYGRLFIRVYYAVSPIVVKLFGKTEWFRNFWRSRLDKMVKNLQDKGVENTPYEDKDWRK